MRLGGIHASNLSVRRLDVKKLALFKRLELASHKVVEGLATGRHKSPFKGFAIEFQEHREYTPGDDLKHLDWKVLAKLDRHYIKQYEEDTSLSAYLVLDASGSMGYSSNGVSKFECGRFIAAAMSHLLMCQEDAVGLVTCTSRVLKFLPPRTTKTHLKTIIDTLEDTRPGEDTGLAGVLHALAGRIKRRGMIMIVSDLFDDPAAIARALSHFAHKKHEVILFQVLDPHETTFPFKDMTRFESLEGAEVELTDPLRLRREYLRQFDEHQRRIRKTCHRLHIDYVTFMTNEPVDRAMARYLAGRMKR
ncbi:MAG: DUF58 domain-containing protein [Verrucomicrobiota bacterium]|nr:DUF58 domain-containing protein [Verrucomicrobiota bacterium]